VRIVVEGREKIYSHSTHRKKREMSNNSKQRSYNNDILTEIPTCGTILPFQQLASPIYLTASNRHLIATQIQSPNDSHNQSSSSTREMLIELTKFSLQEPLTQLRIIEKNNTNVATVFASSTLGSLFVFRVTLNSVTSISISQIQQWNQLHNGVMTSVDICQVSGEELNVITGGEDGAINVLHLTLDQLASKYTTQRTTRISSGNMLPIVAVRFQSRSGLHSIELSQSFFTLSVVGEIKLWDLKKSQTTAEKILIDDTASLFEDISYTTLEVHPARPNLIAIGDSNGTLTIWDVTQNSPLYRLQSHQALSLSSHSIQRLGPIWKIEFQKDEQLNITNVITGSHNGQLIVWKFDEDQFSSTNTNSLHKIQSSILERRIDLALKHDSILSFDQLNQHFVVLCDNGKLYYAHN
jgi:WD40 repeat protein